MKRTQVKLKEINPKQVFKTKSMLINWIYDNIDQLEEALQVGISDLRYVVIGIPFEERPDLYLEDTRRPSNSISIRIHLDRITKADFQRIVNTNRKRPPRKSVLIVTKVPQNLLDWVDKLEEFCTEYIILKLSVHQIGNSVMAPHLEMVNYNEAVNTQYFTF